MMKFKNYIFLAIFLLTIVISCTDKFSLNEAQSGTIPVLISTIKISSFTDTSLTVSFNTFGEGNTKIKIGRTIGLEMDSVVSDYLTSTHVITVGSLQKDSIYYFKVFSTNDAGTFKSSLQKIVLGSTDPLAIGDTLYIQQYPVWDGFHKPQDILIGREPFIYIADTDSNKIVMLDISGQELGSIHIRRPIALAQDYQLNLLVCGELVDEQGAVFSAVFKINLVAVQHNIGAAPIDTLLPKTSFDYLKPNRKYTGVCVFANNSFLVSRTGPADDQALVDPANSILVFSKITRSDGTKVDSLTGRVPLLEPEGTGLLSANKISSLTSFKNSTRDIIVTLIGNNSFRTQWLQYVVSSDFTGYRSKIEPFTASLMNINRFLQPEDVAIDNSNNIFVADAAKDSIFKFDSFGEELQSFGGSSVFNNPHAVEFFNKILYVVDTDNNRILRFVLSTDLN
ncbi:MAG: hypothetical protein V1773_08500 [bacterium]